MRRPRRYGPRAQSNPPIGTLDAVRTSSSTPDPVPEEARRAATGTTSGVGPGSPDVAGDDELTRLGQELARVRQHREQAENDGRPVALLERGIAAVRRDRDAGTSGALRRQREVFEELLGDVDELVVTAARVAVRLNIYGLPRDSPPVVSGVAAGDAALDALRELLTVLDTSAQEQNGGARPTAWGGR